ncbi:MAG: trypsin-like serine protease, partial [Acidimicrobiales bacterium]
AAGRVATPLPPAAAAGDPPAEEGSSTAVNFIINGPKVTDADVPWLAAVMDAGIPHPLNKAATFCTGALITPTHVITAGHCITDASAGSFEVAVGIADLGTVTAADRIAVTAITHPDWLGNSGDTDLAILTLATPSAATPLPLFDELSPAGRVIDVYGWGAISTSPTAYPAIARTADMAITTSPGATTSCGFASLVDHQHQLCFDDTDQSPCFGDSGGPLVYTEGSVEYLVGAVSAGDENCSLAAQAIAERVIDSAEWIESITGLCIWTDTVGSAPAAGWTIPCWSHVPSPAYTPANDVPTSAFYAAGVAGLYGNEITTGTTATTYTPDDIVTRGQLAAFLWRFAGEPAASPTTFTDVTASYQLVPVGWMAANGFTKGTTATTYSPDDTVTRGQLVTFLWRLMGQPAPAGPPPFVDVPAGQFFTEAVAWASETGVTNGFGDGTFRPDTPVTRGEMATFLLRLGEVLRS